MWKACVVYCALFSVAHAVSAKDLYGVYLLKPFSSLFRFRLWDWKTDCLCQELRSPVHTVAPHHAIGTHSSCLSLLA